METSSLVVLFFFLIYTSIALTLFIKIFPLKSLYRRLLLNLVGFGTKQDDFNVVDISNEEREGASWTLITLHSPTLAAYTTSCTNTCSTLVVESTSSSSFISLQMDSL